MVRRLRADDVGRLKAFGAFQQIELDGLPLIQGAVAVLLDRGKVYEHIFPRRALDKPIPFRSIEPLHCTFLSHEKLLSPIAKNSSPVSRIALRSAEAPLKETG